MEGREQNAESSEQRAERAERRNLLASRIDRSCPVLLGLVLVVGLVHDVQLVAQLVHDRPVGRHEAIRAILCGEVNICCVDYRECKEMR